jgi:uncharacterized membrane protein
MEQGTESFPLEIAVKAVAVHGALFIEGIAGIMILFAALRAGYRTLQLAKSKGLGPRTGDTVRFELGKTLSLALEFLVGADVLRTAVSPSWNELGKLAAIVGIRTVLNYFLERESESLETEVAEVRKELRKKE